MRALIALCAARARVVLTALVMLLVAGSAAYLGMPREAMPTVPIPLVFANVVLDGVSPVDSERLLVRPMEEQFQSLEGLKEMRATAFQGGATVVLEFDPSVATDDALDDVRAAMDRVLPKLPAEIRPPTVKELDFTQRPVLTVSLAADLPERTLLKIARDLRDKVIALPVVLDATISGVREEQVEIVIDPLLVANYGLSQDDLFRAVSRSNRLVTAGALDTGQGRFTVSVPGLFQGLDDIVNLPVKSTLDATVKLSDVAEIRRTFKDRATYVRVNGKPAVSVDVTRRADANVVELTRQVRVVVEQSRQAWPAGVAVTYPVEDSKSILDRINSLINGVIASVFIVMAVCIAVLGIRNGLIVGVAIPGSFLIGMLAMAIWGITLNVMALFGLIIAVGMLVDGAIIVVDAADKYMAEGMDPQAAYTKAAQRMAWPIITTTLTTIAAFLPLMLWPGLTGKFFSYLPISVICVLTASLVMALFFVPALGARFAGRAKPHRPRPVAVGSDDDGAAAVSAAAQASTGARALAERYAPKLARYFQDQGASPSAAADLAAQTVSEVARTAPDFDPARRRAGDWVFAIARNLRLIAATGRARPEPDPADPAYVPGAAPGAPAALAAVPAATAALRDPPRADDAFTRWYGRVLAGALNHPTKVLVGTVALLVVVVFAYFKSGTGIVFFPPQEPDRAEIEVRARGNLSIAEQDRLIREVEVRTIGVDGIEAVYARTGRPAGSGEAAADLIGTLAIRLMPWDERRPAAEIIAELRGRIADIPGIETSIEQIGSGPPRGGAAIQLEITAADPAQLGPAVTALRAAMDRIGGFVNVEDSRPLPGIEWQLTVDREEAARYGADVTLIGQSVQLVTKGLKVGAYRPDDSTEEIDIVVRYPEEGRSIRALDEVRIETQRGLVPMSNFVKRSPEQQAGEVARVDARRVMTLKADVAPGRFPAAQVGRIKGWLAKAQSTGELPAGVGVTFKGEQRDAEESGGFLGQAMLMALFLIAIIMLVEFDSFFDVALVLSAAVLSTTGVFLGLLIFQQPFSVVMTGLGVVAAAGVVVGNNIVLIDAYNMNRKAAFTAREAALYTGIERFRPVLLTSGTAIVGLIPTALGIDVDFINREVVVGAPQGKWWAYLAQAICYGLVFAKILTLIVTPCALLARANLSHWWQRQRRRWRGAGDALPPAPVLDPPHRQAAE
ncbi:MAG: efflux RND transporter permease subunit [Rhodospirillaceae bacterium]|nr:efflux RND transporter permease subunit [Rhodospirillaceae bacterium]